MEYILSITLIAKLTQDKPRRNLVRLHKIIKLPFAPFIGMNLIGVDAGYEVTLDNALEFSYSVRFNVFYYSDEMDFDNETDRAEFVAAQIEEGWKEGHGYGDVRTQGGC